MSRKRSLAAHAVALAAMIVTGCGIDQGGVIDPGPQGGGAASAATTLISGPITGFGSVLVNDLTLDASSAQILIDGRFATEADLAVGQMIRAVAVPQGGRLRALSIVHEENLVGPIEALDAAAGALTVLGQRVVVDAGTHFEGSLTVAADLRLEEPIVVSGLTLPSGAILATFIRRARPEEAFQITAAITDIDAPSLTFRLGDLTIDYSQAMLLQLATGSPELGLIVEVKGASITIGVLAASEVRAQVSSPGLLTAAATSLSDFEAPLVAAAAGTEARRASFVGYVTTSELPGSISLADIDVLIDATTIIDGRTLAALAVGAKVQVEGSIIGLGQIRASRIKVF